MKIEKNLYCINNKTFVWKLAHLRLFITFYVNKFTIQNKGSYKNFISFISDVIWIQIFLDDCIFYFFSMQIFVPELYFYVLNSEIYYMSKTGLLNRFAAKTVPKCVFYIILFPSNQIYMYTRKFHLYYY